jgi:NYN domain
VAHGAIVCSGGRALARVEVEEKGDVRVDRCAVFVDAGWFLSEAAQALTGRGARSDVVCRYRDLVPALARLAAEHTGLPLLRIYWYDAAPDAIPGAAHMEIGGLPDVKLRLGRISHHEQKGVDALLILDLTTLARERAIANALVVSGDEDIREGIAVAQSLGVRVTLGAVALPEGRPSLATTLVLEADDQLVVDADFLRRYVQPAAAEPGPQVASVLQMPGPTTLVAAARPAAAAVSAPAAAEEATTPREFGFRFGAAHADGLSSDDLRALQREAPMIPSDVAAQLFRDAEQVFGPIRGRPEIRRELKAGYWDHVMRRR